MMRSATGSHYWLPVAECIKFKISVLTFNALKTGKPTYLFELLQTYEPPRSLCSSSAGLLAVPDIRSSLGRRSFAYTAPQLWNSLPASAIVLISL